MAVKSIARRRLDRWVYHPLQSALMFLSYGLFWLLPIDAASALGGWVGRVAGPWLVAANRRAMHNLALAMPELTEEQRRRIVRGMWDNIGRTFGEYPHLVKIRDSDRVEVVGAEHVNGPEISRRPRILIGGHVGNWEVAGAWTAKNVGRMTFIYRVPNNILADRLIQRIRSASGIVQYSKGFDGTKGATRALARGDNLGMLLDQKLNQGIAVPFFGRDAMTTPALALFALRFDCAVVPAKVERVGGAHFRMIFYPELVISPTGDRDADILAIMTRVNQILEGWIREHPEQWTWMHRRWVESVA
jgi:KDO2-lipid IV(A) lauroyltransferase